MTTKETRAKCGTRSRYVMGCRCEPCRAANRTDRAARRSRRPFVDAGPVLEHVRALRAAGMSRAAIAKAARVSGATLARIAREPIPRMQALVARRILRVRVEAGRG